MSLNSSVRVLMACLLMCGLAIAQMPPNGGLMIPGPAPSTAGAYAFNIVGCNGNDDSGSINSVISSARTLAQFSITNAVSINFPTQTKCAVGGSGVVSGGPLNFTGFTKSNLTVNCNGSTIYGQLSQGPIESFGTITAGSGGTPGTYSGISLTGGSGTGATANITVNGDGTVHAGGVVLVNPGTNYIQSDTISALSASIGGTTGFSVPVTGIGPVIDALGSVGIIWNNCHIIGDATHEAGIGIQIGRIDITANDGGGSGMIFNDLSVTGNFTITGCYNFSGEGVFWNSVICTNADTGANAYAMIQDGFNHFNVTSSFVTELAPIDSAQSFNQDVIINAHIKSLGGASNISALWFGGGRQHRVHGYGLNNAGSYCVTIYNEAVVNNSGLTQDNVFDIHCEGSGGTDEYLISGNVAAPVLYGLTVKESIFTYSNSMFKIDSTSSVTSYSVQNANISVAAISSGSASTAKMFNEAQSVSSFSGVAFVPAAAMWNEPNAWQGSITLAGLTWNSPDRPGPLDFLGNSSGAWSSARRLGRSYTGAIINIKNNTSSATADIYPDASGQVPLSSVSGLLVTGATGNFVTQYDQSGSATGNLTQGTTASQPTDTIQLANLNNRNVAQFGDGGAIALPSSGTLSGLFTSGGFASHVINQTGTPTAPDRVWQKTNAIFQYNLANQACLELTQSAATTAGTWIAPALTNGGHVVDVQYNASSNSNVPVIGYDGVSQSLSGTHCTQTATTQPVGAISADAGTVIVGNQLATAGARGFIGSIAEVIMWKTTPAANVLEAIRRNQAGFYGLTTVQ